MLLAVWLKKAQTSSYVKVGVAVSPNTQVHNWPPVLDVEELFWNVTLPADNPPSLRTSGI